MAAVVTRVIPVQFGRPGFARTADGVRWHPLLVCWRTVAVQRPSGGWTRRLEMSRQDREKYRLREAEYSADGDELSEMFGSTVEVKPTQSGGWSRPLDWTLFCSLKYLWASHEAALRQLKEETARMAVSSIYGAAS